MEISRPGVLTRESRHLSRRVQIKQINLNYDRGRLPVVAGCVFRYIAYHGRSRENGYRLGILQHRRNAVIVNAILWS
ncbi:Uncharacterised protein [Mycobacterium tuberculosis]|uniref:Uncharacterized protein n=1 Tax=Mycobacterium tuberculosis TaxID=1773 RepID=A0A655IA08_MYCTX|nr:hypothetical protein MRGA423_18135 [Mycobacterium tuberculosis RGTB423]AIH29408.1 hypothetical protein T209_12930 [Mycobacterium tuberculosis]EFD74629.1 predicted protein [Mycobacterium tuberculosis GM 1503]AIH43068.1 hypothetical protein IQ48_13010 [Mycobacterium tuberculosis]COV24587.1 Uncharacterised protein [Mycobacterium tuberculosis]